MVQPDPLLIAPIRDVDDVVVIRTAITGGAEVICTTDEDFFAPPACDFLRSLGVQINDRRGTGSATGNSAKFLSVRIAGNQEVGPVNQDVSLSALLIRSTRDTAQAPSQGWRRAVPDLRRVTSLSPLLPRPVEETI